MSTAAADLRHLGLKDKLRQGVRAARMASKGFRHRPQWSSITLVAEDQSQTSRQRLTVAEASEVLGVTVEAVRGRIKRGTLKHERDLGAVYVLLAADQSYDQPRPDDDQTSDRSRSDSTELISAKDETISTLREQLRAERQAHAEARRLLAAALERIPAIQAPQGATESSHDADEQQGRGEPRPDVPGAQEGVQRPWYRRWFGG